MALQNTQNLKNVIYELLFPVSIVFIVKILVQPLDKQRIPRFQTAILKFR